MISFIIGVSRKANLEREKLNYWLPEPKGEKGYLLKIESKEDGVGNKMFRKVDCGYDCMVHILFEILKLYGMKL